MPHTTMGVCVPHSADRYVDDLFHEGTRTLYIAGKKYEYECTGDWALKLKKHSDEIIEFIQSHDKTRHMFLVRYAVISAVISVVISAVISGVISTVIYALQEASKEHTPSARTMDKPVAEREPKKQSKSAGTRMSSEFCRLGGEAKTLSKTYIAVVT